MSIQRFYYPERLKQGGMIDLSDTFQKLVHVLRKREGDRISVFNERDGQWAGKIQQITKKTIMVHIFEKESDPVLLPEFHLYTSILKHDAMGWMLEKATELGVTHIYPIVTERTVPTSFNIDKYQRITIEAACQCERTDIPSITPLQKLEDLIRNWSNAACLAVAVERQGLKGLRVEKMPLKHGSNHFLVGPEGGFSEKDIALLKICHSVYPLDLGPLILRAETAAIKGIILLSNLIPN